MGDIVDTAEDLDLELVRFRFAADSLCGIVPPAPAPKPGPPPGGALDGNNYMGRFNPREGNAQNGAQSLYEGCMVATSLSRDLVQSILPVELQLATPKAQALSTHPVIYLLGRQNDPRALQKGQPQPIPFSEPYTELILLIPFTVGVGRNNWHNYAVRMYLDYIPAIGIGDAVYAYAKEIGEFARLGSLTEVRQFGRGVFESELKDPGVWMTDAEATLKSPGYRLAKTVFDMPIIGVSRLLGPVCSYFEWNCNAAQIAEVRSVHRFVREFVPGMQGWTDLGLLGSDPDAAFNVRNVVWRLSIPPPMLEL